MKGVKLTLRAVKGSRERRTAAEEEAKVASAPPEGSMRASPSKLAGKGADLASRFV